MDERKHVKYNYYTVFETFMGSPNIKSHREKMDNRCTSTNKFAPYQNLFHKSS